VQAAPDPRGAIPIKKVRDIYIPNLHIDTLAIKREILSNIDASDYFLRYGACKLGEGTDAFVFEMTTFQATVPHFNLASDYDVVTGREIACHTTDRSA
jgi:hypothetical protein